MISRRSFFEIAAAGGVLVLSGEAGRAAGLFAARLRHRAGRHDTLEAITPTAGRVVVPALANSGIAPPPPAPIPTATPVPADTRYDAPAVFQRGDPSVKVVYLTMDDDYATGEVSDAMDIAKPYGAHLTFFPYGQVMAKSPDLWREVARRGHGIENHTLSHKQLPGLSDEALYEEMEGWNRVAREVLGKDYAAKFFRPPGGAGVLGKLDERIPRVATQLGMKIALWSADSEGWKNQAASDPITIAAIVANALAGFGPGSVVLQHAVNSDILAQPAILEEAKRRGLACKILGEGIR